MGQLVTLKMEGRPAGECTRGAGGEQEAAAGAFLRAAVIAAGVSEKTTVAELAASWIARPAARRFRVAFEIAVLRAFRSGAGPGYEQLAAALATTGFGEVVAPEALIFGDDDPFNDAPPPTKIVTIAREWLTEASELWHPGSVERLPLRAYLDSLARDPDPQFYRGLGEHAAALDAYGGLWHADALLGCARRDLWVGAICKPARREFHPGGDAPGIELEVVPGGIGPTNPLHRHPTWTRRSRQLAQKAKQVELPINDKVWFALVRVRAELTRFLEVGGHLTRLEHVSSDWQQTVAELDSCREERAVNVADRWLTAAGATISRGWTPRAGVSVAA